MNRILAFKQDEVEFVISIFTRRSDKTVHIWAMVKCSMFLQFWTGRSWVRTIVESQQ